MRKSIRMLAIGAAVVAGPLLATAAATMSGYVSFEQSAPDDDFSLDGVFVDSGDLDPPPLAAAAPMEDVITVWGWIPRGGFWGGGSSWGGGYDTGNDSYRYGDEGGDPQPIPIKGRDCAAEKVAAEEALDLLYALSATARALIDSAAGRGVALVLIRSNFIDLGPQATFDQINNEILWDPFFVIEGVNSDGSAYKLAPIMVLAHELVHAGYASDPMYQGRDSESRVMPIANQIAAELNAATGGRYETRRDNHESTSRYNSHSATSSEYSIVRPGCP
jgi:hypothetical protein